MSAVLKRLPQARPKNNWLSQHGTNITSQSGEDGIIEKIFELLPHEDDTSTQRWCVEFGAWDGHYLSNTWNLLNNKGWNGVLLEADPLRFNELRLRYQNNPNVYCINELVTFEGERSLDSLLLNHPLPRRFDLISIDVDGNDYHIWEGLQCFEPQVVVIEYNPTVPSSVIFIQERDMSVYQGSSLLAMVDLGKQKGYELVCVTTFNAIFVRREHYPLFKIPDNSLPAMRDFSMESLLFQLYDGTLVMTGCKKLLWHKVMISHKDLQVLPPSKRKFPFAPPQHTSMALYKARLLYMACLQRYTSSDDGPQHQQQPARAMSPRDGANEQDVAELIQLGAGLLPVPAHEEDGHEILGYALLLASHDRELVVTGPRRVAALYERRGDMENKNHGVKDGLRWYKRALYSLCPSADENIPAVVNLLCKIGAAYIALRSWSKSLFWLHLATTLAPDDIPVWKQLVRLHRKRGDKIALEGARQRVGELEASATEATLQRVRALSPTMGFKAPLPASDVISIESSDDMSRRGSSQHHHQHVLSLGAINSGGSEHGSSQGSGSDSHLSALLTNRTVDSEQQSHEEWNGDMGVDITTPVSTSHIFGVDFSVDTMIDPDYREREKAITELKLMLAAREEELKQSLSRSSRLFKALVGTTCCTTLAAVAALALLGRAHFKQWK